MPVPKANVLIIEDDIAFATTLKLNLENQFKVYIATNSVDAISTLSDRKPNLILLDLKLDNSPNLEGYKILKYIDKSVPVIVVSAKNSIQIKIKSFKLGVDDYLCKPFAVEELRFRINAVLKRNGQIENIKKSLIDYRDNEYEIFIENKWWVFKKTEYKILKLLIMNKERTISRDMIISTLWLDKEPESNSLDVHINHIRNTLKQTNSKYSIKTTYGIGYKFTSK